MHFFPFSFYSIFFLIAQFLCERSIKLLFLLYKIVVHKNEIQKCKYLGHVSFIIFCTANCFASVLQCLNMCLNIMLENETDIEFVFWFVRKLTRTLKLTRTGALRQTYFLIWPNLNIFVAFTCQSHLSGFSVSDNANINTHKHTAFSSVQVKFGIEIKWYLSWPLAAICLSSMFASPIFIPLWGIFNGTHS